MASNQLTINIKDHGVAVDPLNNRVKCRHCDKVVSSGFSRLKYHLAGIRGDVTPCLLVPVDVKEIFRNELSLKKQANLSKEVGEPYRPLLPLKRSRSPQTDSVNCNMIDLNETEHSEAIQRLIRDGRSDNSVTETVPSLEARVFSKMPASSMTNISVDEAKKSIARFFYETATDFNAVKSPSFLKMMADIHGTGQVIPSGEELKGWILADAVKEMQNRMNDMKSSWGTTGCSVILDGWNDDKGRKLVNILVNCPKGAVYLSSSDISAFDGDVDAMVSFLVKVLEEVGTQNVVQVITYSTSAFMKEVGKRLTDTYRHVFWTVSASTCLELVLENFGSTILFKEILEKARTITRFVQIHPVVLKLLRAYTQEDNLIKPSKIKSTVPYLTLENIVLKKKGLKNMFASSEWKNSDLSDSVEGKRVASLVEDHTFWNGALVVLNAAIPIVRVLCLINNNNEPQIGLIYETIDQAKETISDEFKKKKRWYMPFWKQIDEVWDTHLHSPLHGAAYFLNPILFYSDGFDSDLEVSTGLFHSVIKMKGEGWLQELIMDQSQEYLLATGAFSIGCQPESLSNVSPVLWWTRYGENYPELQRLAIQILSQSCDGGSKFQLKRRLVEKLLTKGGDPIEQQTLKDLIFVNFNLQLQNFQTSDSDYVSADEIDPTNDWMANDAQNVGGEPALD